MFTLVFVMGDNSKDQEVLGFLDLGSRLRDVVSVLELGSTWLTPNRFDLTYTNVKTQKLMLNQTKVRHTRWDFLTP